MSRTCKNLQVNRANDKYKGYSRNPVSFHHNTSYIATIDDDTVIGCADFVIDSFRSAVIDNISILDNVDAAFITKAFIDEFLYWNPFINVIKYTMTGNKTDINGLLANGFTSLTNEPNVYCKYTNSPIDVFKVKISDIQPSQLTINNNKLKKVTAWVNEPEDIIIPLIKLQNELVSIDGHTRLTRAYLRGFTHVFAYYETGHYDEQMYKTFVSWCKEQSIHKVADLTNRIVEEEKHNLEWIQRCQNYIKDSK